MAMWVSVLVVSLLVSITASYDTLPRRVFTQPGKTVNILGRTPDGSPLSDCKFQFFSTQQVIDFSRNEAYDDGKFKYWGRGLERGECGITIKNASPEMDGVIKSDVRVRGSFKWQTAATALRVTNVNQNSVAKLSISPSKVVLNPGNDITITCNADRPINLCYFYLPGPQTLDLNQGVRSKSTDKYRYFGSGLEDGKCGVTLKNVDETYTGFVVCKVGRWPDGLEGPWETDVSHLTVEGGAIPSAGTATSAPPLTQAPPSNERDGCGVRLVENGLISNGHTSLIGEFPWHAGLYMQEIGVYKQVCGGTLITKKIVISAAHCFWASDHRTDKDLYKIVLGKHYLDYNEYESDTQRFDVAELHMDKRFRGSKGVYLYDIAIVRLSEEAVLGKHVNVACVDWGNTFEDKQLAVGQDGLVSGWGLLRNGTQSITLQYVKLPWISEATCIENIPEDNLVYFTRDKFCAGFLNQGVSVCKGDSGGGLLFVNTTTNRYYLRGIVSVSFVPAQVGKCSNQLYTAFTRISAYMNMIAPFKT